MTLMPFHPSHSSSQIPSRNCLFSRSSRRSMMRVKRRIGNYIEVENGPMVYDASGGAAVRTLGGDVTSVRQAVMEQIKQGLTYVPSLGFETAAAVDLAQFLIASTEGKLSKAVFYSSGSEAVEAALKIIVQYHAREKVNPEPSRTIFIARKRSYHGATLGALDVSGHAARKATYKEILGNRASLISACYPYREQGERSDQEYIRHLKQELEDEIKRLGPRNVAGFIIEPVVGAALGCVPAVDGYLKAMKEVCERYGVILVFDEIMCGMGRMGTMHAWQREGVAPDIQLIGKGLGAGFAAISGMLLGTKIVDGFENGSGNGAFNHGHTFENFPMSCSVALAAQTHIQDNHLLEHVKAKGQVLERKLRDKLSGHPHVGDIRGRGLFWGIEFVRDKKSKEPFSRRDGVAEGIHTKGVHMPNGSIYVYPGSGAKDGVHGDHIIIAPVYDVSEDEIDLIACRVTALIGAFFEDFIPSDEQAP